MRVRDATGEDVPGILAIYNHAVLHTTATADLEPQPLAARKEWLAVRQRAGLAVLVAEDDTGAIAGWASLNPYHARPGYRFTVENSVYVAESSRGRGVGSLLLAPLVERAQAAGVHAILAGVDSTNEASLRLHARFGFEKVGQLRQVVWKFDRWLDVVYLERLF
jgi:L-amino acid N-acyltransferase